MRDLMTDDDTTVFMPSKEAGGENKNTTPAVIEGGVSHAAPPAKSSNGFGGLAPNGRSAMNQAADLGMKPMNTSSFSNADQGVLSALQLDYRSGINPLVENATEIFFAHYQIIKGRFTDAEKIRAFIQDALLKFEMRSQQASLPKTLVKSAKYVLCTFLDETVLQTDWGRDSSWSQQSLLAQFFNETWGGATVFKIRQFCLENIHEYVDLLEMIYICMCLGFKGQYGTDPNGETLLDRVKRDTYQAIIDYRGDKLTLPLSPHGGSSYKGGVTLKKEGSLKWIAAACLGVLIVGYASMSIFLSFQSEPVYQKVLSIVS